jgi:hypothetical protein
MRLMGRLRGSARLPNSLFVRVGLGSAGRILRLSQSHATLLLVCRTNVQLAHTRSC